MEAGAAKCNQCMMHRGPCVPKMFCIEEEMDRNKRKKKNTKKAIYLSSTLISACGSKVFQVYFDDAKDSSHESRVKQVSRIKESFNQDQDSSEDSREDSR